jgi:hypothetical protein
LVTPKVRAKHEPYVHQTGLRRLKCTTVPKHSAHFQHITQHKELIRDTQHNELIRDTQHNLIQHNDNQHNELIRDTLHNIIQNNGTLHSEIIRDIQHNDTHHIELT